MMEAFMTSDLTSLWPPTPQPPPPSSASASSSKNLAEPQPSAFNQESLQQRLQALIEGATESWTYAIFWQSSPADYPGGPDLLGWGDGYYKGEENKSNRRDCVIIAFSQTFCFSVHL